MYKGASTWVKMLQMLTTNNDLVNNQRIRVDITAFDTPIYTSNVIAICKHDENIVGMSQNLGKPIIELDEKLTKAQQNSVNTTREEFAALCELIHNIIKHKTVVSPKRKAV